MITWLFVAFNLTISYKEVLVANLVKVGYEKRIEDFQDLTLSGKKLFVPENTFIPSMLFNDQRESVKQFLKSDEKIVYYNYTGVTHVRVKNR